MAATRERAVFADIVEDERTRWPARKSPLPGSVLRDGPDTPEMVLIPPGSFIMGVPEAESAREKSNDDDARPQRQVTIRAGFWLGIYPVTRGEFAAFVADKGRDMAGEAYGWVEEKRTWEHSAEFGWHNPGFEQTDRHPVICVSHDDTGAYAKWVSERAGKRYRLPRQAEWEYAARASTTTRDSGATIATVLAASPTSPDKFPRTQKFVLGDRIEATALDVMDSLIAAADTRARCRTDRTSLGPANRLQPA